jgi:hypothetical protein
MTHEFIGQMLAVRRESITLVARRLQAAGVIRYTQGHTTIVDRRGLEARVCECYEVVQNEFVRLLGWGQGRGVGRVSNMERALAPGASGNGQRQILY